MEMIVLVPSRWVGKVAQKAHKYALLIGVLSILSSCGPRLHTIVNPDIDGSYITYAYKITSTRDGTNITPSYTVIFQKSTKERIAKFRFWTTYYYGQTFSYIKREKIDWDEKSVGIQELNNAGTTTFSVKLQNIEREPMRVVTGEETYMAPDGERIEVLLWRLTVVQQRN